MRDTLVGADHMGRDLMSEAQLPDLETTTPVDVLLTQARTSVPALVDQITTTVRREIPAYAGPDEGNRPQLIKMAVSEAVTQFLRSLSDRPSPSTADDLFRRMGYGEAREGHSLEALSEALHLAAREAWKALRDIATELGLTASDLGALGNRVFALLDHLQEQAQIGHTMARQALDHDVRLNRQHLITALLDRTDDERVRELAERANWPLPVETVVIEADSAGDVAWPDEDDFDDEVLLQISDHEAVAVCVPEDADAVVKRFHLAGAAVRVATSGTVPASETATARAWTRRALDLAERGVLPREPIIDCTVHRTQLWLHAEPLIRHEMARDLLEPFLDESAKSRQILSQTLLVWLETRASAPAIAAILGVHPQTVRYRWKRINELLGDVLDDPETVLQLTMMLKASVPIWLTGDHADFDLDPESDR